MAMAFIFFLLILFKIEIGMHPVPVPMSISKISELVELFISLIASSTIISVSGLGIKTFLFTKKSSLKNSLRPVIYATGSPLIRRAR